jgi:hypothetical protein
MTSAAGGKRLIGRQSDFSPRKRDNSGGREGSASCFCFANAWRAAADPYGESMHHSCRKKPPDSEIQPGFPILPQFVKVIS